MKLSKQLLAALLLSTLTLQACNNSFHEKTDDSHDIAMTSIEEPYDLEKSAIYDTQSTPPPLRSFVQFTPPTTNFIPTVAASSENDGTKKFIRTASLGVKVGDIPKATHAIENIIIQKKGFIINSDIRSDHQYTEETPISKDSLLVSTYSILTASLTLRVHHSLLDATLRELAPLAEVINYRSVRANDVTLDLLRNKLEQEREKKKGQRITSITGNNKGHKLHDLLEAEEAINAAQEGQDEALLSKLDTEDEIEYSTITIALEQDPIVFYSKKLAPPSIKEYKTSFITRLGNSIANSWEILLNVFFFTISIWPILIFILGSIIFFRYYRKRRTKKVE